MNLKSELKTNCELHWWNMGKKTLSFQGTLGELLKEQGITFTKRKTDVDFNYTFYFKNKYGISYKVKGTSIDFVYHAKQFIQMGLVRMGDRTQLYVDSLWRPTVTVNC